MNARSQRSENAGWLAFAQRLDLLRITFEQVHKRSAIDKALSRNEGDAVVFASLEDLAARIDDPGPDVPADDIMVLQNAGPRSAS